MEFRDWEPVYEQILQDFGYSRDKDEDSARELALLASTKEQCDDICLKGLFGNHATVVAGPPLLGKQYDDLIRGTVLSVGIGTALMLAEGIIPDLVVTDLDGDVENDLLANEMGAVLVVHAPGDNIPQLRSYVPMIKGRIVLTTQSSPIGPVRDFGGFTDGDRALALAAHFGARGIRLIGFDLRHPRPKQGTAPEVKAKKLRWAERLIGQLKTEYSLNIEYL
jgi:2-amino-4-hydroxy-6-hydroxymethyldihydropteridine diphosphokinase